MRAVFVVVALIAAFAAGQPAASAVSPSPSVTATMTPTTSPQSLTNTASVTPSPQSLTNTASPSGTPVSISNTPSPMSVSATSSPNQGRYCERDACTGTTGCLASNSRCCGGFCISNSFVPATVAIGGTCDSSATACTACMGGLSCVNSVCIATGIGFGCMTSGSLTACTATSDCASGLSCLSTNKCGISGIGVGGTCNANNALCYAGLTCTNNVCTPVAAAGTCTIANLPYDPSSGSTTAVAYLHGACVTGYYCEGATTTGVCTVKIATNTACSATAGLASWSCASGLCNVGFCITKASVASQAACNSDAACVSGFCSGTASGNACQNAVNTPARCTTSDVNYLTGCVGSNCQGNNKWCTSGNICSYFDGMRPQCMPGSVAPGGACNNNDQCSSLSSWGCLNGGVLGAAGVCSGNSGGQPCIVGNSTGGWNNQGWCGLYGGNTCGCVGASFSTGGTYQCSTTTTTVDPCASLATAAATAAYTAGYYQASTGGPLAHVMLASNGASIAGVKSYCCSFCSGGSTITLGQGLINSYSAVVGRSLDCTAGTVGPAWTGTTLTNVCAGTSSTTGQTVALAGSSFLGTCKAVTGAASSVVPSLALLVAIVAATLALFL